MDGPVIQGSRRILKGSGLGPVLGSDEAGSNDRRNDASSFTCLTVQAMAGRNIKVATVFTQQQSVLREREEGEKRNGPSNDGWDSYTTRQQDQRRIRSQGSSA